MTEYKREKPRRNVQFMGHTCYEGHDCYEKWTVENHLAEALHIQEKALKNLDDWTNDDRSLYNINYWKEIKHHILQAWDKSK